MASHWPPAELCSDPPSRKYCRKWSQCRWMPFMIMDAQGRVFPNAAGQRAASEQTPQLPGIYEFAISRTPTSNTK